MAVTSHFQAPTIGLLKHSSAMLRKIHFHPSPRDSNTNLSEDRKTKQITDSHGYPGFLRSQAPKFNLLKKWLPTVLICKIDLETFFKVFK